MPVNNSFSYGSKLQTSINFIYKLNRTIIICEYVSKFVK